MACSRTVKYIRYASPSILREMQSVCKKEKSNNKNPVFDPTIRPSPLRSDLSQPELAIAIFAFSSVEASGGIHEELEETNALVW